jgi:hypothetical protein
MKRFTISTARHPRVAKLIEAAKKQKSPRLNVSDIACDAIAAQGARLFKNAGLKIK